jgi:hypothetical protein
MIELAVPADNEIRVGIGQARGILTQPPDVSQSICLYAALKTIILINI